LSEGARDRPVDPDAVHHRLEDDGVVALAGGQDPGDGSASPIRGEVDLRGQPATGAA
jgi:hypothetical protein